jgi:hypothetical protein
LFAHHTVGLTTVCNSTARHSPSWRCRYSCNDHGYSRDQLNCDSVAVYPNSFVHQSAMSPKKTPMQEQKRKSWLLNRKWK